MAPWGNSGMQIDLAKQRRIIFKAASSGFSLFELFVVSIVSSLLMLIFFDRLLSYQEAMEKSEVELTVINMRSSLRYRVGEMLLHGEENKIIALVGSNPIKLLDTLPLNYAGELIAANWNDVPPGKWYFDIASGEVMYRLKHKKHFVVGPSGLERLRFRVNASVKKSVAGTQEVLAEGVTLVLLEQYKWF